MKIRSLIPPGIFFIFFATMAAASPIHAFDTWQFALGMGTALVAHEAGHEVAGYGEIKWRGTNWHCVSTCNAERIAAAGFVSQAVVSEVMARAFDAQAYRDYRRGIRFFNIVQPLYYAARDHHDLENFTPNHRQTMRAVLVVFAVYSLVLR